jgi:hypothetical protein
LVYVWQYLDDITFTSLLCDHLQCWVAKGIILVYVAEPISQVWMDKSSTPLICLHGSYLYDDCDSQFLSLVLQEVGRIMYCTNRMGHSLVFMANFLLSDYFSLEELPMTGPLTIQHRRTDLGMVGKSLGHIWIPEQWENRKFALGSRGKSSSLNVQWHNHPRTTQNDSCGCGCPQHGFSV